VPREKTPASTPKKSSTGARSSAAGNPTAKKQPASTDTGAPGPRNGSGKTNNAPAMAQALPVQSTGSFGPDHDEIRRRAYELYEEEGRQEGRHEEYWHRAEAELRAKHRR
jgi:hypothetical protein